MDGAIVHGLDENVVWDASFECVTLFASCHEVVDVVWPVMGLGNFVVECHCVHGEFASTVMTAAIILFQYCVLFTNSIGPFRNLPIIW